MDHGLLWKSCDPQGVHVTLFCNIRKLITNMDPEKRHVDESLAFLLVDSVDFAA